MNLTAESACHWCGKADALVALHTSDAEHQQWICVECEELAERTFNGLPCNPDEDDRAAPIHPEAREHRCWDHAQPAPAECADFDYVCRDCGAPLRSDSWYKHQE